MKFINRPNLPIWLFIISLIFILIIRDLFRDGMFMDGLLYASVAKNLSNGLGSFWHPHFSQTTMTIFHEQPPLLFGIESIFFRLCGDSIYVERLYGLLILCITIFLFHKLWSCIFYERQEINVSWLPILLWLSIPVCLWSYSNNMEEPTMAMFDLASVIFIYKAIIHQNKIILNLTMAATMLVAASMCKGFQGLFPLTVIFSYWAVTRNISFSKMVLSTIYLSILIIGFYGLIILNDTVHSSYEMYLNDRIVKTFSNPASTHTDWFYLIEQLFLELLPVFILLTGIIFFMKCKKHSTDVRKDILQTSTFFFFIALSGSLPLMLTLEQSGFYLVTAMPYYVIGFSVYFSPLFSKLVQQLDINSTKFKIWRTATIFFLSVSIAFTLYSIAYIPKRDTEEIHDINCMGNRIGYGNIIGVPQELNSDWSLHTYFNRYFYISLDASSKQHKYYLFAKTLDTKRIPDGYKKIALPTNTYLLYIKN